MRFKEFGDKKNPAVILLHGGGLSWWSIKNMIDILEKSYYVVAPIIDGHGEDGATKFCSIQDSAWKLIEYIDREWKGKVYALGGLSIGAQIATEILSVRKDICSYGIIESALIYPIKGTKLLTVPIYSLLYGLIKQKWFSKLQAKALYIPEDMFPLYYEDSLKITKESLINITLSNGCYTLKETIKETTAKVLVIVGGKEISIMKKSAKTLSKAIPNSRLYIAENYGHGELSIIKYQEYLSLMEALFKNK